MLTFRRLLSGTPTNDVESTSNRRTKKKKKFLVTFHFMSAMARKTFTAFFAKK